MYRIVDAQIKGNVVRFYLTSAPEILEDVWGDDWDDWPYEDNCGTVYSQYYDAIADVAFSLDYCVSEPADNCNGSHLTRENFKDGVAPFVVVAPIGQYYSNDYLDCIGHKDAIKFYFGQTLDLENDFCGTLIDLKENL